MITYKRNIQFKQLFKKKGLFSLDDFLPSGSKLLYTSAIRLGLLDVLDYLDIKDDEFVLIPPFCPQGIVLPLQRKKIMFKFYHLEDDYKINIKGVKSAVEKSKCKVIFIIHYFGVFNEQIFEIKSLCEENNILLIEDTVHAMFSKDKFGVPFGVVGDISMFSLPKFLPVPDGAVFVLNNPNLNIQFSFRNSLLIPFSVLFNVLSLLINSYISKIRSVHVYKIIKYLSLICYSLYYYLLCLTRKNHRMSSLSERIVSNIDLNELIELRSEKFLFYNQILRLYNNEQITYSMPGYPIISSVSKIFAIKKILLDNGIEPLFYAKGWNYIPDSAEFNKEVNLHKCHVLIPITPQISNDFVMPVLIQIKQTLENK